jgi:hypothetical protein
LEKRDLEIILSCFLIGWYESRKDNDAGGYWALLRLYTLIYELLSGGKALTISDQKDRRNVQIH